MPFHLFILFSNSIHHPHAAVSSTRAGVSVCPVYCCHLCVQNSTGYKYLTARYLDPCESETPEEPMVTVSGSRDLPEEMFLEPNCEEWGGFDGEQYRERPDGGNSRGKSMEAGKLEQEAVSR